MLLVLLVLVLVLEVVAVVVVDGNGVEPLDCDDWFDFEEVWRDRDAAGADHGVEEDDDVSTCSSLRTEISSKKFFVIVLGAMNGSVA